MAFYRVKEDPDFYHCPYCPQIGTGLIFTSWKYLIQENGEIIIATGGGKMGCKTMIDALAIIERYKKQL